MPRWRIALVAASVLIAAAAGTLVAVAVNAATNSTAGWYRVVERHPLWWTVGATAAVAAAGLLVWAAQRWYERGLRELVPARQLPEPWVVDRPAEVNQIVRALRRGHAGTVGITTAVHGAGGFGKTTVARVIRSDRRVLRWCRGRVYWVTVGRDACGPSLTGTVNDLIAQLEPERAVTFASTERASEHLGAVLAKGPRRLLILDDVWTDEQLAAFPVAGSCARLMTTRNPSLITSSSIAVKVDQMSDAQSRALLTDGLPSLPPALVGELVEESGRWPLLLRLVNKILANQARLNPYITAAAKDLLGRLRHGDVLQIDQLTGIVAGHLDVGDPDQRHKTIRATIEASTSLLSPGDHDRLAELAVFAEDEAIPITLVESLWQTTGELDQMATRALCARLADLALLTLARNGDGGIVELHDVIRDFLREELGCTRLAQLHQVLIDTAAEGLPVTAAANGDDEDGHAVIIAWSELPESARYLREHLIGHLVAAGRSGQAEEAAADLRWVRARLQMSGPAGPIADLALIGTQLTARLQRVLGQAAHLLAPTDPPHSLTDILCSRVGHDPDWGPQAKDLAASCKLPALMNEWPLPDLPSPALRHVLTGHTKAVTAVAIAPDGNWLASGGLDQSVRIWDPVSGRQRTILSGHTRGVEAVAIAPDGTWLASSSVTGTVRIWDLVTGQLDMTRTAEILRMSAFALGPDGRYFASGFEDGSVRIWHAANGQLRAHLTHHDGPVWAVAIAPDGTWLASGSQDGTVRIGDLSSGQEQAVLTGHTREVSALAIAPDGTWLASAGPDKTVRIWDLATSQERAVLSGHTRGVRAVAIAPDGTWLASGGFDKTVRIWDLTTGRESAILTGHTDSVNQLAIGPDGTWLASGSQDGTVRIWDPPAGQLDTPLKTDIGRVTAVAFAPDGTWLASGSQDGTVRIWDLSSGQEQTVLTGHARMVTALAIAPDSTWLASGSADRLVRIWDPATGEQPILSSYPDMVRELAIAPDGTWLASASRDGTVRIWVLASDDAPAMWRIRDMTAAAFAADGTSLTTGSIDRSVRIWDLATGQQRAHLTGRTHVTALAIARHSTWLASGSWDGTVRIWDLATGQQRAALTGHTDAVTGLAISADDTWLASVSRDRTVRIWDPSTGAISAVMRVDSALEDCVWSAVGHMLAIAGDAGLYLFDFLAGTNQAAAEH